MPAAIGRERNDAMVEGNIIEKNNKKIQVYKGELKISHKFTSSTCM